MLKTVLFILPLSIFLLACDEGPKTPDVDVYEVKNIGELSTIEYTVGKIIKLDDISEEYEWYEYDKYGDRKILMSCKAKVKAGIDLKKIDEDDINVNGSTIEIVLPPAEITSFSMDPSMIRTEMESVTGFRPSFTQAEKNGFLKQGEAAIREDLSSTGILEDAEENAISFLYLNRDHQSHQSQLPVNPVLFQSVNPL